MKPHRLIAALAACLPLSGYAQPDSVAAAKAENDRHENLLRIEAERQAAANNPTVSAMATDYCVSLPFPSTPSGEVYEGVVNHLDDTFNVKVWRIACDDINSNVLVRVEPVSKEPSICSSNLHVLQNENQYSAFLTDATISGFSFCDKLLIPKTFLLAQWSFGALFNDDAAFSIVWGDATINVGAYAGQQSGCAQGGVSTYTPATGMLAIPSVQLPSGKCYDVEMQRIAPFDTLNFSLSNAVLK